MGPLATLVLYLFGATILVSLVVLFVKACQSQDWDIALGVCLLWLIFIVGVCLLFNL